MNDSNGKKILVIGSKEHSSVDCVDWGEEVYVGDYDFLIVDTTSLNLNALKDIGLTYFNRLKSNIVDVQENKGIEIYCIISRLLFAEKSNASSHLSIGEEVKKELNNYSWSPIIPLLEVISPAKTLDRDNSLINKDYLAKILSYNLIHFDSINNTGYIDKKNEQGVYAKCYNNSLLKSNINRMVSFSSIWKLHQNYDFNVISQSKSLIKFIPPTQDIKVGIDILIFEIIGQPSEPLPGWINSVIIEGENEINSEIESKDEIIRSLNVEINALNASLENLSTFKKLLYSSGSELEEIVEITLGKLGIKIDKPEVSNLEDRYFLTNDDKKIFIEIRGVNRLMNETDLGQLIQRIAEQPISKEYPVRGIFIFNHKNKSPLEEREDAFHYNIEQKAKTFNICLIDTQTLFQLINKKLAGNDLGEFKSTLLNTIGIFKEDLEYK